MLKFMSVTTLLLGAVFFQVSGGFDFQPRSAEADSTEAGAKTKAQLADAASGATTPKGTAATRKPGDLIAANMASAKSTSGMGTGQAQDGQVTLASMPVADPGDQMDPSVAALPLARVNKAVAQARVAPSSTLPEGAERRAVADAVMQNDPMAQPAEDRRAADIRAVAGSHVNLRQGPGTSFSVVDQLGEGDTVEVIGKERSWLKLRVAETGRVGWMADFLVTAAAN
ncbi:SH3 domain-containing protein [Pseudooceanicola sediminis]|uniref:SH3 domain-containing protein n=1 Tax=Pseudooceanicola sediminis TaxID=2211117 RepID=A0A399IV80_9RHOB|nr:SH3 domain-containing protein [Pseudooceanicola sediminis]KAA2314910.1 SH3 domain-containing protein [Puniceibacterium sp. HSS470]RII36934.1 SH3 domain-containing protein [Pseudooceanicola sediminis]|tara:strand:+ start:5654 stop:6334 length:681 start_codon:yes stop_codon:yes gene_type:complete